MMLDRRLSLAVVALCAALASCESSGGAGGAGDADADTDTDTDSDADTDADTDSESEDAGECAPDCGDKECGDDGCGGYCGTCVTPPADVCLDAGVVDHFDQDQVGICEISTCVYLDVVYSCPIGSSCATDYWGTWACAGQTPIGNLESAADTSISGWACDADTPWTSIGVHLYFDSVPGDPSPIVRAIFAENVSEPGVNAACGGGDHHRFAFVPDGPLITQLASGLHTVYAFGINSDGVGGNPQISNSPLTFTIP
ncbi:MAG: hypothetical protein M0R80_17705 [Proteobacteria bacterium]|jgi:hypothetical protein|nr:hypothetical protein [Pseudomonadota bacterium]